MSQSVLPQFTAPEGAFRYRNEPVPLHFPEEDCVPVSIFHLELRTALYDILKLAYGFQATIGSDQFVYWDPTDVSKSVAPDLMIRFGQPHTPFASWKVWERGAPHLALEIISESDRDTWSEKLNRYRQLGVLELVRFDVHVENTGILRIWDNLDGDLVERDLPMTTLALSKILGHWWIVLPDPVHGYSLRLAKDEQGKHLLPTRAEAAEQRVQELEALLKQKK